jgi:hypothetical protein
MIEWWWLFHNLLRIMGLAAVLGALSMANYEAKRAGSRLRRELSESGFQLWFSLGMMLFSTGLALGGGAWWVCVIWALLALAFAAMAARLLWRLKA